MLTCLFFGGLIVFIMFICLYIDVLEEEKKQLQKQQIIDDCNRIIKLTEKILNK